MKTLTVLLLTLTVHAHAATLVDRTFGVRVEGASITCTPPLAPNGHNYPVYTNLKVGIDNYSLYFANVWSEVRDYRQEPPNYNPCETYQSLMTMGYHVGSIHQVVTETYGFSNGVQRDCLRTTREENTLTLEGQTFSGVRMFLAGPMDPSHCAQ